MAKTAKQVKDALAQQGKTQKEWATTHGFDVYLVTRVLNGTCKARRGKGHQIAVALGLKDAAAAS
jgi:gp16 family phage-associated protein